MTKLTKRVTRETQINYRGRNLIVALDPDAGIMVKEKGRRQWFELDILTAYEVAMKLNARK
jgi:hypothetical protein